MKTHASVLAIAVLTAACYSSPVPLGGAADAPVDSALIGSWQEVDNEDGTPASAAVYRFNDHEYYVEFRDGGDVSRGRAYITRIGAVPFLNVNGIDSEDREYSIYRYEVSRDGVVTLYPLEEHTPKFQNSEALAQYLAPRAQLAATYAEPFRLRRVAAP